MLALYRKKLLLSTEIRDIFWLGKHILSGMDFVGGKYMRECEDTTVDLDDLIFDEDAGGPSQR